MKKEDTSRVFIGMMAQFDTVETLLKACCWSIQFINEQKLFPKYLDYLKKNMKD